LLPGLGIPSSLGECLTRHQQTCRSDGGSHLSWCTGEQVSVAQKNLKKTREPIGSPTCKTGKNPDLNNRPAFGRQKGSLINSQRTLVTLSEVKLCLSQV
jgi:hypothetical protein